MTRLRRQEGEEGHRDLKDLEESAWFTAARRIHLMKREGEERKERGAPRCSGNMSTRTRPNQ